MRIGVIIGFDPITGESEPLATGAPAELNKFAKELVKENSTKWPKVRIFEDHVKQWNLGEPKAKRGRPKKED